MGFLDVNGCFTGCYWDFVDGNSMDMMKFIMLYGFSEFVSGMNHGGCSILGGIAGFYSRLNGQIEGNC